jgi:hydroxymethylbilane synthase
MARLRIGSRGSQLARWQAEHVAAQLRKRGHEVEIEIIKTSGDTNTAVPLTSSGTKGIFIKEIEEALAAGEIHLAVHSLKDLPTDLAPQFELAAVLEREDPRDALVSRHANLEALPQRARVGTGSLRRQAQLHALRPDLRIEPVRGNVDTRLRKLHSGEFDAIILAAAGLRRLEQAAEIKQLLAPDVMCPAAGQGALAIEIRAGDAGVRQAIEFLDHCQTRSAIEAERALLGALGGGCQVPIGAYAKSENGTVHLLAKVGTPDGSKMLAEQASGADPFTVGRHVAGKLLRRGATEILRQISGTAAAPEQP